MVQLWNTSLMEKSCLNWKDLTSHFRISALKSTHYQNPQIRNQWYIFKDKKIVTVPVSCVVMWSGARWVDCIIPWRLEVHSKELRFFSKNYWIERVGLWDKHDLIKIRNHGGPKAHCNGCMEAVKLLALWSERRCLDLWNILNLINFIISFNL